MSLAELRLDLALTLDRVPQDSVDIVVRRLASLANRIVGAPEMVERLGRPERISEVEDRSLLAISGPYAIHHWSLQGMTRPVVAPAFSSDNLAVLKDAALAGLGLACIPLLACHKEIEHGSLQLACEADEPNSSTLYAMTPSYRSTTSAVRTLIDHLRNCIISSPAEGMRTTNS